MNIRHLLILCTAMLMSTPAPGQPTWVSIQDIQRVSLDSLRVADSLQTSTTRYTLQASPYLGQSVETTGICVVPKGVFGFNSGGWNMLLYDTADVSQWRAIWYRVESTDTAQAQLDGFDAVEVGDIVTVRGIVGEFPTNALNSLTQLNHIPGEAIVGVGQAPVPPAARIDASMLYQGLYPGGRIQFTTGEPYESMIVELTDLVVPSYLNPGNGTFNMVQNGNMLSDYDASDYYTLRRVNPPGWTYALPPLQSEIATVRGAVWVVSGGNNARGYHIAPVFPGDLVLAGTLPLADSAARSPWVVPPDSDVVVTVHAAQQPFGAPIDSVVLYYGVDDAPFVAQQMTIINPIDSIYQGVIPKSPDSSFVRYFFKAYDSALKSTSLANYSVTGAGDTSRGFFCYRVLSRPLTIQDIQYTPYRNGYSPYAGVYPNGATVTISGIVTADTTDIRYNQKSVVGGTYGYYMQSGNGPWSGIWLTGDSSVAVIRRGDSISVTGVVQEWPTFGDYATTRIAGIQFPVIHSSGNPVPDPVPKKTSVFAEGVPSGDPAAEPYEGMLVRFDTVTVTNIWPYFSDPTQYEITDGSGPVWVHRDGTNLYTNQPADSVGPEWTVLRVGDRLASMTGVIHFSVNRYKFVPRSNADFGDRLTGVEVDRSAGTPSSFALFQNYPNPFNPATTLRYSVPSAGRVTLKVFSLLGQEIRTLVDEVQHPGTYTVQFDAAHLASGVYFYQIQAGAFVQVKKMVVLK